jgi:sec1 family domain-containing protein 1
MNSATRSLPLKDRQRAVVEKALSPPVCITYPDGEGSDGILSRSPWQVLVVDEFAREMLSALLTSRDLRRHGITLQTRVDAPRGPVPDAPATYVIAPTPENIAWLAKDVTTRRQYERVSIAFTGAASRSLLAALAAQLTVPAPIARVVDMHTSFVSLEQQFFSLAIRDSFVKLKRINDDDALHSFIEPCVSGLLSVFVTLGLVPVIRAQPGGPAAAVAVALDARIRDSLELFRSDSSVSMSTFRRPLLLLMDRDFDFNAMLHHTWTYQALVHDAFETTLSSVTLPVSEGNQHVSASKQTPQVYDLDKRSDEFWAGNAASPFPEVAQAIEESLIRYRSDVETINRRAGGGDDTKLSGMASSSTASTSALADAVSSLPELAERKHGIDVHINIATAVLDEINKRALDSFFELEGQIMNAAPSALGNCGVSVTQLKASSSSSSAADYKAPLLELLRGSRETSAGDKRGVGSANDRLRLFMIFYMAFGAQLTETEMAEFRSILTTAGASLAPLQYVRKLRSFRHDLVTQQSTSATSAGSKRALLSGIMNSVVSRGYRGITSVAQNAKDLIVEKRKSLACASILNLFMNDRERASFGSTTDNVLDGYLMFDPKLEAGAGQGDEKMRRMVFSDAVLFVVGGGNYVEFEDCMSTIRSIPGSAVKRNVLYGTTEVLNANQFIKQLQEVSSQRT